jgi:serine/threonine protein kinase/tetratricopeptide (TPR) repeat protein
MSDSLLDLNELPPALALQLEHACSRFEAMWRSGERPRLEDFLADADDELAPILLRELVLLDLHYRRQAGERPNAADYSTPFPRLDSAWLAGAITDDTACTVGKPGGVEQPGTVVGPYRLMEKLGEGGFGVVFRAHQRQPLDRQVALKLLKPGMDSRQILSRFGAERQALALMDHPNIARVLDGGATATGRPYFVMELVSGVPITDYCQQRALPSAARLTLFVDACRAVQHAHQKGIIHRDVKPSNVLVTEHDGKPIVKVIDFGVAKALGPKLTDDTVVTGAAQLIGTPLYMSPEQAELGNPDVDTRSDIYSLGVLLYELMTGTTPFDRNRLQRAGYDEMRRIIREEEPPRPSSRIQKAESRTRTDPAASASLMSPSSVQELDWIVMKALEKDRTRRYETASALAADVERFLRHEPVLACPPSRTYRARKFIRRNRGAVLAGTMVLLALVAGIVGTSAGLVSANAAAEAERNARDDETAQRKKAEESEADMRAFANFLADQVLAATRPEGIQHGIGINVTMAEALEKAEPQIEKVFAGQPRAEAFARHAIGVTWRNLSRYPEAIRNLERAVEIRQKMAGRDATDTLNSMHSLAMAYMADGKQKRAIALLEEVATLRAQTLGATHAETLLSKCRLGTGLCAVDQSTQAVPLLEQTLEQQVSTLGDNHVDTIATRAELANAYRLEGRPDRAIPLLEEVRAYYKAHPTGEGHPEMRVAHFLARAYQDVNRLDETLKIEVELLEECEKVYGPEHPQTLVMMNEVADSYTVANQVDKALPIYEKALASSRKKLGDDHPHTLVVMDNLGSAYQAAKRFDDALVLIKEAMATSTKKLGPDDVNTLTVTNNLASLYWAMRKLDESIPLFEDLLPRRVKREGKHAPETIKTAFNLIVNYHDADKVEKAMEVCEEWLPQARALPVGHAVRTFAGSIAVVVYTRAGRQDQVEPLVREQAEQAKLKYGADSPLYANQLAVVAMNLLTQKKYAEAEPVVRECLAIRQLKAPDDWTTFNTLSMLGGVLLSQGRYADAEPLLLEGYKGIQERAAKIPPQGQNRPIEALERLVQLYTALAKQAEAAAWQQRLDEHRQKLQSKKGSDKKS